MAVELYTLSCICVLLLVIFIPVHRVRVSVPHLAIVLWLAGINMIRGINGLVWDGNADIRIPVWCDIATKFMLGANVALPAAFLCISRKLELLGSSRTFFTDSNAVRNRRLELFLCYAVPVIYAGLHPISQDHRFDLAMDYGCSPSIHNSPFALAFIWIPPFIFCCITLAISCYSVHHISRVSYPQFVVHIESRTNITSSIFFRQLTTSFVMTAALILNIIFHVFTAPALAPWSSWDAIHSQLWRVNVVTNTEELNTKRVEWWNFFAISALYILLSFTVGEEAREAFRWVIQLGKKTPFPKLKALQLPLFHCRSRREATGGSTSNLLRTCTPQPLTLELKSGWDDMLDTKTSKWQFLSRMTPSPSPPSPTPSRMSSNMDDTFMVSTLSYLSSPTARSLGISHLPHAISTPSPPTPPPVPQPPPPVLEIPPLPGSPPPLPPASPASPPTLKTKRRHSPESLEIPAIALSPLPQPPTPAGVLTLPALRKPVRTDVPLEILDISPSSFQPSAPDCIPSVSPVRRKPVRTDVPPEKMSFVSPVLNAPWPVPPSLEKSGSPVATSPPKAHIRSTSQSRSSASSEGGMSGYPVSSLSNRRSLPVGTANVPMASNGSVALLTVKKPLKSALKRPTGKEQTGFYGSQLQAVQETD